MIGEPEYKVQALMDINGAVTATVYAVCSYGNKVATASTLVEDEEILAGIAKAFGKLITSEVREKLGREVQGHALASASYAMKMGEDING